jgi:hypothetical protein
VATLVGDQTWRDLDLSGIITDQYANAVMIYSQIKDSEINMWLSFRPDGRTGAIDLQACRTQVANQIVEFVFVIALPSSGSRTIEYSISEDSGSNEIDTCNLSIQGWWI